MSATQEREQQLVRGTVTSLLVKGNESWQVVVRPDNSQYDKKLWTKDQMLVGQIQQQGIGQRFDFMCNASYWTNQQQQQVRSLWIEAVAQYGTLQEPAPVQTPVSGGLPGMSGPGLPMGQQPQQGWQQPDPNWQPAPGPPFVPGLSTGTPHQPAPGPLPQTTPDTYDPPLPHSVRELRILRQTAMKCACIMQAYIPEAQRGSMAGLQQMSEWFVRYFMGGPQDVPAEGFPQQSLPVGGWQDPGPPDWVQANGPVPADYQSNVPTGGSEDAARGAYAGGFPS